MLRPALLSLALLAGCAPSGPISRTLPVTEEFGSYTLRWSTGASALVIRLSVITNGAGVMEVCGAYGTRGTQMREHSRSVLSDLGVTANGQVILSDLGFFTAAGPEDDLPGAMATCRSTGLARPAGAVTFGVDNRALGRYRG